MRPLRQFALGSVAWVMLCASDGVAQTVGAVQRAEIATQAEVVSQTAQATTRAETPVTTTNADLGEQVILSRSKDQLGLGFTADTGLYYTSNAFLTRGGGRGDMFYLARGGVQLNPNIAGGLFANAYFGQDVFLYSRYTQLSFLSTNAGGGFSYIIREWGNLTFTFNYAFTRMLSVRGLDQFYLNHALVPGVFKEFQIGDASAIQLGWNSSFSLSAYPSPTRRNDHLFWVGYRHRLADYLELQLSYLLALYDYTTDDGRMDLTQIVGATFLVPVTSWASLSLTTTFSGNNSNRSQYEYTTANVGGILGLNVRF